MEYQLTLQFRGASLSDYDTMITLEEALIDQLGDSAIVDGHDCGAGQANIFIITTDPVVTFQRVRTVLERCDHLNAVTAAYRELGDGRYVVLWPEGSFRQFSVT